MSEERPIAPARPQVEPAGRSSGKTAIRGRTTGGPRRRIRSHPNRDWYLGPVLHVQVRGAGPDAGT